MTVDLTVPSPDLGLRLIIELSTDPAERSRVANDPAVVAIATTALQMPVEQRRRVSDRYADNFNTYRTTLIRLHHRVRRAGGPNHLTTRALNERLHNLLDCPGEGACKPYHVCNTCMFTTAVADAIYAHLARGFLTDDEQRMLAAPWTGVAGKVQP